MNLDDALTEIRVELERATKYFTPFNSAHEGYAVIKEELDELWEEIRKKPNPLDMRKNDRLKAEAIQVAAMGLRFLIDIVK